MEDNNMSIDSLKEIIHKAHTDMPAGTPKEQVLNHAIKLQTRKEKWRRARYYLDVTLSLMFTTAAGALLIGQKVAENTDNLLPEKMYQKDNLLEMNGMAKQNGFLALLWTLSAMGSKRRSEEEKLKTYILKEAIKRNNVKIMVKNNENDR